jgi:hypothetical protein
MSHTSTRFNTGVAGIYVSAGLDDDGQPYVSINTEDMVPQHRYDENTGLLGTERPYTYEQDGASAVVKGPDGQIVARHFPQPDSSSSRLAARAHAEHLNDGWAKQCGMPAISIHLNDAELYDARDHNPKLRKEETSV